MSRKVCLFKILFRKPEFLFDLNFFLKLTAEDCYIHIRTYRLLLSKELSPENWVLILHFSLFREFWLFIASLKRGFRKQETPASEKLFPDSQAMLKLRLATVIPATPPSYLRMYGDSTPNDTVTHSFFHWTCPLWQLAINERVDRCLFLSCLFFFWSSTFGATVKSIFNHFEKLDTQRSSELWLSKGLLLNRR